MSEKDRKNIIETHIDSCIDSMCVPSFIFSPFNNWCNVMSHKYHCDKPDSGPQLYSLWNIEYGIILITETEYKYIIDTIVDCDVYKKHLEEYNTRFNKAFIMRPEIDYLL